MKIEDNETLVLLPAYINVFLPQSKYNNICIRRDRSRVSQVQQRTERFLLGIRQGESENSPVNSALLVIIR